MKQSGIFSNGSYIARSRYAVFAQLNTGHTTVSSPVNVAGALPWLQEDRVRENALQM